MIKLSVSHTNGISKVYEFDNATHSLDLELDALDLFEKEFKSQLPKMGRSISAHMRKFTVRRVK